MLNKRTFALFAISLLIGIFNSQSQVSISIDTNFPASCIDDGSFVLSPVNLPSGQPYQWDYTSWPASYTGTTASQTNDTFSDLTSGVYIIRLAYIDTGSPFTQFVSRTITVGTYVIDSKDSIVYVNTDGIAYFDTSYFLTYLAPSCMFDSVWMSADSAFCSPSSISLTISARASDGTIYTSNSNVTILDTLLPTISCTDTTVYLDSMGSVIIDTSYFQTGFADNCGVDSVWITDTSFTCNSSTTIQVYVRDNSGNIDSYSSIITVLDILVPNVMTNDSVSVYKVVLEAMVMMNTSLLLV
ncbi:MAG: hypothetical protein ABF272_06725 [Flavobacteriales bacterium]